MQPFIGQPFDGNITGITAFGLFVGLENGIEGLVHISFLTDDEYEFDETTYTMVGQHGGHVFRLGDPMKVTLARVNVEKCEIDFVPGVIESLDDLNQMMERSAERRHKKRNNNNTKGDSKQGKAPWFGSLLRDNKKGKKNTKKKKNDRKKNRGKAKKGPKKSKKK